MATSIVMRQLRGVPDQCPYCESGNLSPIEGLNPDDPEVIFERPVCGDCGWMGDVVSVGERSDEEIEQLITREGDTDDACGIMAKPLIGLIRPSNGKP
jgi:hypothetical protein